MVINQKNRFTLGPTQIKFEKVKCKSEYENSLEQRNESASLHLRVAVIARWMWLGVIDDVRTRINQT